MKGPLSVAISPVPVSGYHAILRYCAASAEEIHLSGYVSLGSSATTTDYDGWLIVFQIAPFHVSLP
jgi:hypothetical protein